MVDPADRHNRAVAPAVRWLAVIALAMAAGLLAGELFRAAPAGAQGQPGAPVQAASAAPEGVFAVAGEIARDAYGVYLVDLRRSTICLYQYYSGDRRLRLVAARTYVFDAQLDSYNTEPTPEEVSKLVAGARRLKEVTTKPNE